MHGPRDVCHLQGTVQAELTRSIRRFWWGESSCKRKTHWIAWDKFTKPKGLGGLGFRDLKVFNQALWHDKLGASSTARLVFVLGC